MRLRSSPGPRVTAAVLLFASATALSQPATPPSIHVEPEPVSDLFSDSVGATAAEFRVDEAGASTYSIPIYAPPGTAGVTPQVALVYGSRNPTGPMGPGWSISGLSSIARCKATIESGDVGALADVPINFDNQPANDAYCLDGQRLYPVGVGLGSGSLACPASGGATGQRFAPELDPATRVCGYTTGAGALGFSMWLVQGRDGAIRRYGATDNARLAPLDGAAAVLPEHTLQWSLDRTVDSVGNAIVFTYLRDNVAGELHIAEIGYTAKFTINDPLNAVQTRAPYNRIAFTYAALPDASKRIDFIAGAKRTLSKQLTLIDVFGAMNHGATPNAETRVRSYTPIYQSAALGTRLARMISLRECAPDGANEVCYPRTQFEWLAPGTNFSEGYASDATTLGSYDRSMNYLIGSRVADVNGDGRQDLVWVKDRDCPGNPDPTDDDDPERYRFIISHGTATGLAPSIGVNVFARPTLGPSCTSSQPIPSDPPDVSGAFHLFDFTGDGRDDLLLADTATWKIYPTTRINGVWVFRSTSAIDTGIPSTGGQDARLADFNGDGLPDLLYQIGPSSAASPAIRFMERVPTTTTGELTFRFSTQTVQAELALNEPGISFVDQTLRSDGTQGADFNGDGRSDLLVQIKVDSTPPQRNTMQPRFASRNEQQPLGSCPHCLPENISYRWSVLIYDGINAQGRAVLREDTVIVTPQNGFGSVATSGVQVADINGDSLSDVMFQCSVITVNNNCLASTAISPDQAFYVRLNTGSATPGARFSGAVYSGLRAPGNRARHVQLSDVNGDQRLDLLYQDDLGFGSTRYPLRAHLWRVTDTGGVLTQNFSASTSAAFGNAFTAIAQQNPDEFITLFLDWSGDGAADALRFKVNDSHNNNYYLAKASRSFGGGELITSFTNGLGASTEVDYGSLVYSDLYERAYDGPAQNFGRGSPVFDVFGPLWAVQRVRTSAPTRIDSGNPNSGPDAKSLVVYRYRGARLQSGGRGFLGFAAVSTDDRQTQIRSTTEYRQDYPFLGRPAHSWAETLPPSPPVDICQTNPDHATCIVEPPDCGVRPGVSCIPSRFVLGVNPMLSDATSTYETEPLFNPSAKVPIVVTQSGSVEQKFDLDSPGAFSYSLSSSFDHDAFGNLLGVTVIHSQENHLGQLIEVAREVTVNVYGCRPEFSPPLRSNCGPDLPQNLDAELRRLGRLSLSAVVQLRPGENSVVRRTSFEYDATSRLLVSEIQGPYDDLKPDEGLRALMEMRTDHQLDSNGNRTLTVKCSIAHYANRSACLNLAGIQQRQWEATPSRFQRYSRTEYDTLGRFVTGTKAPYFSSSAGNGVNEAYAGRIGLTAGGVLDRTPQGDPRTAISAHGVMSIKRYGALGRERFLRGDTGAFSRTVYTWCTDVVNADIAAGAPRANCPVGAVFRVMTDSTATAGAENGHAIAPRAYAYFDRLGREMLKSTRIYQGAAEDPGFVSRWSSVATEFDALGRTLSVTVPYFSLNPEAAQSPSTRAGTPIGGAPAESRATFDVLSRARNQTLPEQAINGSSSAQIAYNKLQSISTNPRSFTATRQKNAMGEVVSAVDSNAFEVHYAFEAAGNLKSVSRSPTNGSHAGRTLTTTMQYDRLGRKVGMNDPDKGAWTYEYNALGELIRQVDAKGQTQQLYYDAMGRMWKRTENRQSGAAFISEPTVVFIYDTASLGETLGKALGLIAEESSPMGGFTRTYQYDLYGRGIGVISDLEENVFYQRATFDAFGRAFQSFDASPSSTSPAGTLIEYSTDGFPIRVREAANELIGTIYQEILALDARSQVRKERLGESAHLTTVRTYDDPTGRLLTINTGNDSNGALQRWDHTFDKHGNLTSRWNRAGVGSAFDLKEDFAYDSLDRLDTVTLTRFNGTTPNAVSLDLGYDQLGNVMSKSSVGTYAYGSILSGCAAAGPHAVTTLGNRGYCYDANGNQTIKRVNGLNVRTIKYTGYDMAEEIVRTEGSLNAFVSFRYGPDRARWKRIDGTTDAAGCLTGDGIFCNGMEEGTPLSPNNQSITYYVGNTEHITRNGVTEVKRYIGGYLVISTIGAASPTFKYLLRDVLGSVDVIADTSGTVLQRMSFDAHGSRRFADPIGAANLWGLLGSAQAASFNTTNTTRGYTGHEQLDQTGLVHMNGRIYDPELGRFIQADPMVESEATQGLNRYSYVLNNPLSATDPSGYSSWRQVVGAAIGIVAAAYGQYYFAKEMFAMSFAIAVAGGFTSSYMATGNVEAGLWGAFSAGAFWGLGYTFSVGTASTLPASIRNTAEVAAHAAVGGILQEMQGGKFGHGFASAGLSKLMSPVISQVGGHGANGYVARAVLHAVVGGTASKLSGGKFSNGAATSAFQSLFTMTIDGDRSSTRSPDEYSDSELQAYVDNSPQVVFELPELPQGLVDFAAGMGDTVSMNGTKYLRELRGINGGVDTMSTSYEYGEYSGIANSLGMGVGLFAGAFKAGGAVTVTRWGGQGSWYMVGGKSTSNWWLSGTRFRYPYGSATTTTVQGSRLTYPTGWEWVKGLWGQRILHP